MSWLVKDGDGRYLADADCPDVWTTSQKDALRFATERGAKACAGAWDCDLCGRGGRVVRLKERAT